VMHIVLVKQR